MSEVGAHKVKAFFEEYFFSGSQQQVHILPVVSQTR